MTLPHLETFASIPCLFQMSDLYEPCAPHQLFPLQHPLLINTIVYTNTQVASICIDYSKHINCQIFTMNQSAGSGNVLSMKRSCRSLIYKCLSLFCSHILNTFRYTYISVQSAKAYNTYVIKAHMCVLSAYVIICVYTKHDGACAYCVHPCVCMNGMHACEWCVCVCVCVCVHVCVYVYISEYMYTCACVCFLCLHVLNIHVVM